MATPVLDGMHHHEFPVAELDRSFASYERAPGARHVAAWDHRHADGTLYAFILEVPGPGTHLELRLDSDRAESRAGFDPVTLAVQDRAALVGWIAHLDAVRVPHSPVLIAIQAWLVVFGDPDGRHLRLHTQETHGPELPPDAGSPWIT